MHLSVTPKSSMTFDRSRGTSRGQTPVPSRGATPAPAPTEHHDLDPKYDHFDYPTGAAIAQSGHPGHTTKEQDAAVHQLRMILEAEGCQERLDTLTLLRFLRARKFNVMQTKQMFMDTEKWRAEFAGGVDQLVREFDYTEKGMISAYYPQYYHKTDNEGRPLYIEQLGKVDLEAMRKITTDERMLQNLVVEYEKAADPRLPACSRKYGHLLETSCTIMDLKGVGLYSAGQVYAYLQMASGILQNHYPERLGKLYCINAPWGFSSVFSMVKRFLDPVTVAKIHILGANYLPELLQQIPKENLPSEFGGECRCPGGCSLSDEGPWKDPQYARTPAWAKEGDKGDVKVPETIAEVETPLKEEPSAPAANGKPTPAANGDSKETAPAAK